MKIIKKVKTAFPQYLESVLQSYSLIFFGRNNRFSLLLLFVTFFDVYTGLAGLLAVITANSFAYLSGLHHYGIKSGNYGFNALLVGLGLGIQFQPSTELYVILFFAAMLTLMLSVVFEGLFTKYAVPYLTFPFLLSIWIISLATRYYGNLEISERGVYFINYIHQWGGLSGVSIYEWFSDLPIHESLLIYLKSLGAIFFQYNILAGILIALGLLYISRISFMFSLTGFYAAYYFYLFIGANINELNYNYIGFNYILTSIAIGGFFVVASRYSFLWVILLIPLISLFITSGTVMLTPLQLPVYSLAFNIVVAMFLYLMIVRQRFYYKPALTGIQFFSPEKNLYYLRNSRERFHHGRYLTLALPFHGTWTVSQGYNGEYTHRNQYAQALDFVIEDKNGSQFSGTGDYLENYYCYNKPVTAPAAGMVYSVIDGVEDNTIGDMNLGENWGNTIIIKHHEHLYSKLSHLKKDTIKVSEGQQIDKGDIIAFTGNSGRSPYPHLHFQMQSTPSIGSSTLYYPIAHYVSYRKEEPTMHSYAVPQKNDRLSNIETNKLLGDAFHFIPGQKLAFEVEKGNGQKVLHKWEVVTGSNNITSLWCSTTRSNAYIYNDGVIHYFTNFEGDKDSLLYYFFLAFYKVPLGFYRGISIHDQVPLSVMKKNVLTLLQDFVAPFHLFMKANYNFRFEALNSDFTTSAIKSGSKVSVTIGKKKLKEIQIKHEINEKGIQRMTIMRDGKNCSAKKISNSKTQIPK